MTFATQTIRQQRTWLRETSVPLRSVTFCRRETHSHCIAQTVRISI